MHSHITHAEATAEQKLAASMQRVQALIESRQYPRDVAINYLSSLLGAYITTRMLGMLSSRLSPLSTQTIQNLQQFSTEKLDAFAALASGIVQKSEFVQGYLAKYITPAGSDALCVSKMLPYYQPSSTYVVQGITACTEKLSSKDLALCLSNFPSDHHYLMPEIRKLVYDQKFQEWIVEIKKLTGKTRLSKIEAKQLKEFYGYVCKRLWTVEFISGLKYVRGGFNIVQAIVQSLLQAIFYVFQGNMGERIFGPTTLSVPINRKTVTFDSPAAIQAYITQNPNNISALHAALCEFEAQSIPWRRYFDRAFAMILPVIIIMTLLSDSNDTAASWVITMILPIFIQLLKATIHQLHYLTLIRGRLEIYTAGVDSWLNKVLLLTPQNPQLIDVIEITKIQLIDEWESVQFSIQPKTTSTPTTHKQKKLLTQKMLAIQYLFDKHELKYLVVKERRENIPALYINAVDAYNVFANRFGFESSTVHKFSLALQHKIQQIIYAHELESLLLNPLKKKGWIHAYWHNDSDGNYLQYDINAGINNPAATEIFTGEYTIKTGTGFAIHLPVALASEALEEFIRNILERLNSYTQRLTQSQPALPQAVSHSAPASAPTRYRALQPAPAAIHNLPAIPIRAQQQSIEWRVGTDIYRSDADNVYMIQGTEHYANPIYVICTLTEAQFNSAYTFERVMQAVQIARFARPRDQTGLFITNRQQLLTVKVLGNNGQGDVRCYARGFLVADNNGPHLYVINEVEQHTHQD